MPRAARAVSAASVGDEGPSSQAVRVLLIEDSAVDRRFIGSMLRRVPRMELDVTYAAHLGDALAHFATTPVDIVLLDLTLPDSWGLETFARVAVAAPHVPIVVLTSADDETLAAQAVRAGAQDFLVKGHVDPNLLGRAIRYARERHQAQAALRESQERYRDLVENVNEIVCALDSGGVITYVSPVVEQISGYEPTEMVGHRFAEFIHPADSAALFVSFQDSIAGKFQPIEFRIVTKSGGTRWLRSSSRATFAGARITGVQSVLMDITDHRVAEEEVQRLNAELEQRVTERTAELTVSNQELEAFCHSVSHDLRAPLRGIDGFSQALLEDYAARLDEPGRHYLHRVRSAAQHMGQLIDDLLHLSRVTRSEMHRQPVDLGALARTIMADLQRSQPERQVALEIDDGLMAMGDPPLLRVVLENLFRNAWKYTSRHASARIEFGSRLESRGASGESTALPSTNAARKGQTIYFVRDDGAGFDMAFKHKLFQPFQRLHSTEEFEGTGIGLATVQRIVQRHGGRVWAEGSVEQGATFSFTLDSAPSD